MIAAINGYALGKEELELALLCDILLASEVARFAAPEIKLGSFPGDGGTQRLPRLVGQSFAMQMVLTGAMVDAVLAERKGLVSEVLAAERLLPRALEIAGDIACRSVAITPLAKRARAGRRRGALGGRTGDRARAGRRLLRDRRPDRKACGPSPRSASPCSGGGDHRHRRNRSMWDYIIAGASSAGCVLANRPSEDPDVKVLLLEAGSRDRNPMIHIPGGIGKLFRAGVNWRFHTVPQRHLDNRRIWYPAGQDPRRLELDQRDDLYPRPAGGLRPPGSARQ